MDKQFTKRKRPPQIPNDMQINSIHSSKAYGEFKIVNYLHSHKVLIEFTIC